MIENESSPASAGVPMDTIEREAAKLDRLLRRTEAAKYVTETYGFPCSPKTLAKLACVSSAQDASGIGPAEAPSDQSSCQRRPA
jgi:hypothetical protein